MGKDITKKCKACELNFSKLKGKSQKEFKFPKNIPVSENMRKTINNLRGVKNAGSGKR